jgi:hypothetical protein
LGLKKKENREEGPKRKSIDDRPREKPLLQALILKEFLMSVHTEARGLVM